MNGVLAKIIINTQSPHAKKELEDFARDLDPVMKKQGIKQIITLRKKLQDHLYEILVIPASKLPSQHEALKQQGYDISPAADASSVRSDLKSYEFEQTIQFSPPKISHEETKP